MRLGWVVVGAGGYSIGKKKNHNIGDNDNTVVEGKEIA